MLISSRITTLQGSAGDAAAAAMKVHAAANAAVDLDINLFAGLAGYPSNSFVFSTVSETMAHLVDQGMKLNASAAFNSAVAEMSPMVAGPVGQSLRSIAAVSSDQPPEVTVGSMFSLLLGHVRNDRLAEARDLGAEAAAYLGANAGRPAAFVVNAAGNLSEMGWLVHYSSASDIDDMMAWQAGDAGYQSFAVRAADIFLPASLHRSIIARIA